MKTILFAAGISLIVSGCTLAINYGKGEGETSTATQNVYPTTSPTISVDMPDTK